MKIELILKPPPNTDIDAPQARAFLEKYDDVSGWWKGHGWDPVPINCLPALGAWAIGPEGDPCCAAWLYQDNSSPVCMLEWLVSDPDTAPLVAVKAIKKLVEFFQVEAASLGYKFMMAAVRIPGLIRVLQSSDFQVTDDGMTHLICNLTD